MLESRLKDQSYDLLCASSREARIIWIESAQRQRRVFSGHVMFVHTFAPFFCGDVGAVPHRPRVMHAGKHEKHSNQCGEDVDLFVLTVLASISSAQCMMLMKGRERDSEREGILRGFKFCVSFCFEKSIYCVCFLCLCACSARTQRASIC